MQQPLVILISHLWRHIKKRRRQQFLLLLPLMLVVSIAEILSIGALIPFLGALTAPESIHQMPILQPILQSFAVTTEPRLLLFMTLAFGLATIIAGALRLVLMWANIRLSFAAGADISMAMYRNILYQPYSIHCTRNSSEVIDGITNKANLIIYSIIAPLLTLISSGVMLVFIITSFFIFQPKIALVTFGGFGLIYLSVILFTRKQIAINGCLVATESTIVIKSLQEGLGGIRDVLIDGSQSMYCNIYRRADYLLRRAQGNNLLIISSPRYVIEAFGMVVIAALAYFLAGVDGDGLAIPILGALALGAQRLLPILQQAYGSWVQISSGKASLQDALDLLEESSSEYIDQSALQPILFEREIELKKINFRYHEQAPNIVKELNLRIPKGSRIGFIGGTGVGKSTLLDIIMGLLSPIEGVLEIDGQKITSTNRRAWQQHIAHVPQAIFLADSTIAENIALGVPLDQIDYDRVRWAAEQSQLAGSIEDWPAEYRTMVGERGIRLSGGERQRIGIARALYKRANVIIFDEATSALDSETERAVMDAIERLGKGLTLLIIAHRLTTLRNCTKIVELESGGIKRMGSYQEIVGNAQ